MFSNELQIKKEKKKVNCFQQSMTELVCLFVYL